MHQPSIARTEPLPARPYDTWRQSRRPRERFPPAPDLARKAQPILPHRCRRHGWVPLPRRTLAVPFAEEPHFWLRIHSAGRRRRPFRDNAHVTSSRRLPSTARSINIADIDPCATVSVTTCEIAAPHRHQERLRPRSVRSLQWPDVNGRRANSCFSPPAQQRGSRSPLSVGRVSGGIARPRRCNSWKRKRLSSSTRTAYQRLPYPRTDHVRCCRPQRTLRSSTRRLAVPALSGLIQRGASSPHNIVTAVIRRSFSSEKGEIGSELPPESHITGQTIPSKLLAVQAAGCVAYRAAGRSHPLYRFYGHQSRRLHEAQRRDSTPAGSISTPFRWIGRIEPAAGAMAFS